MMNIFNHIFDLSLVISGYHGYSLVVGNLFTIAAQKSVFGSCLS